MYTQLTLSPTHTEFFSLETLESIVHFCHFSTEHNRRPNINVSVKFLTEHHITSHRRNGRRPAQRPLYPRNITETRNALCGTWYLPHSRVHNERIVPIIMAGCITHARNGRISTSVLKSDVTIVFLCPDFL